MQMLKSLTVAVPEFVVDRTHTRAPKDHLASFERVTGIKKTRRFEGTTAEFIKKALSTANYNGALDLRAIDSLIVVTQSPDRLSPCMAAEIHDYLKLPSNVPAMDLNHACDGFVLGLWAARRLGNKSLLICVDRLRYNNTPLESLIFSDACAIAVVENDGATFPVQFFTDGSNHEKLYAGLAGEMKMDGNAVFDFVTTVMPDMIGTFCEEHGLCDWLAPHQANLSMNRVLESRSGFKGRCLYSLEEYGNQSMCSIPTALAVNESKIMGQRVLMAGFGAGYTAAVGALWWPTNPICRMVIV